MKNKDKNNSLDMFFKTNKPKIDKAPHNEFDQILQEVESTQLNIFQKIFAYFLNLKNDLNFNQKVFATSLVTASILSIIVVSSTTKTKYTVISESELTSFVSLSSDANLRTVGEDWL